MAERAAIPGHSQPLMDEGGRMNKVWYDFFLALSRQGLRGLSDVNASGISNGEVLVWSASSGKFEAGAN